MKKFFAELIGTFVLVFIGTGTAVLSGKAVGHLGIGIAFGLTIVAAAYSIGTVSGAHLNPAVSIAMFVNKRLNVKELITYIIGQIVGAMIASGLLYYIVDSMGMGTKNLGQNVFADGVTSGVAFIVETVLTFIFILVIIEVTSAKFGHPDLAGLVIGFTLTLIHFVGIPITGMSANPARSIAPAIFVGGDALSQLWVFILAPIIGGILAALVAKFLLASEEE